LVGLRFPLETPLYVYPLGLLGFVIVTNVFAILLLQYFHPGGVKHALGGHADDKEPPANEKSLHAETSPLIEKDIRVDVVVENLQLAVKIGGLVKGSKEEKQILTGVDAVFPAGEVSVIMGPSGVRFPSITSVDGTDIMATGWQKLSSAVASRTTVVRTDFRLSPDRQHPPERSNIRRLSGVACRFRRTGRCLSLARSDR
jgi:hypothetical protein